MLSNTCLRSYPSSGQRSPIRWTGCELLKTRYVTVAHTSFSEILADPQQNALPANARPQAALLASKVYFYLGALDEAVDFALMAIGAFEKEPEGEYRETIIGEYGSLPLEHCLTLFSWMSRQSHHIDLGGSAARSKLVFDRGRRLEEQYRREWKIGQCS